MYETFEERRERVLSILEAMAMAVPITPSKFGLLSHPLISSVFNMSPKSGQIIVVTEENKAQAFKERLEHLATLKTMGHIWIFVQKPYKLDLIFFARDVLTTDEFTGLLRDGWMATEFPHQSGVRRMLSLFKRADKSKLMNKEEKEFYDSLPKIVTIYRGLQGAKSPVRGISWTLDFEKAKWFASRWKTVVRPGNVVTAMIHKDHIFAYFQDRNESEIIVNPDFLRDVREVPIDWDSELAKSKEESEETAK